MTKWCDYLCEHASFPKDKAIDGSGSCHTFQALWCDQLNRYVYKNAPCTVKKEKKDQPSNISIK